MDDYNIICVCPWTTKCITFNFIRVKKKYITCIANYHAEIIMFKCSVREVRKVCLW